VDTGILISIILTATGAFAIVRIFKRSRGTVIKSPKIGFLELSGGELAEQIFEDKKILDPLFESTLESPSTPPQCNVLFLYCRIGPDGSIQG
jgi:hypothetical protein